MSNLPLKNIKVIEFSHMVMGPSAGLILADLGADVIKVEPIDGDKTRILKGSGAGYFPMYNRNKRSIRINLKTEDGIKIAKKLISNSDVLIENFRSGAMEKLGLDYKSIKDLNSNLIYCSNKGFLSGPYSNRTALDEVAQMMGGLAYMTGPSGKPLRAGASVIDVMGGMFGVIAILAALQERNQSGEGQQVMSSLYESTVFLVGQHMAQYGVTGEPAPPMQREPLLGLFMMFLIPRIMKKYLSPWLVTASGKLFVKILNLMNSLGMNLCRRITTE